MDNETLQAKAETSNHEEGYGSGAFIGSMRPQIARSKNQFTHPPLYKWKLIRNIHFTFFKGE